VFVAVDTVKVDEPPVTIDAGVIDAVTPAGRPVTLNVSESWKPQSPRVES